MRPSPADAPDQVVFDAVESPLVSVLVVAWRRAPHVLACLRAVQESVKSIPYEVILVLNEPAPTLEAIVSEQVVGATVLRTRTNVGFGGAVNLAAHRARGELLALLNDDAVVEQAWLEQLVDLLERRPEAGAVGSKVLLPDGTIQEAGSIIWSDGWTFTVGRGLPGTTKRFDYERQVDYCSGCSLLVRRGLWDRLGGLDESFYPAYFEEADLCLRLAQLGFPVWFQPRSLVHHRESASTNPMFRQFLLDRNHELFLAKWKDTLVDREPRVAAHEPAVERAVWRRLGCPRRILVVDDRVPDPSIGSGFARMADVMVELSATGQYHVALLPSLEEGAEQNDALARLGIEVIDEPLEKHLAIAGLSYSLVILSRPHNYERFVSRLRAALPGVPLVYDAEALYFRRIERQAPLALDPLERVRLEGEAAEMRVSEEAIARDADHIVCISRDEASFFEEQAPGRVEVNAPMLSDPHPTASGFSARTGLGFVAGWFAGPNSPNADGLLWFARHVLPKVRARVPGTQLYVTGAAPPENVRRLAGDAVEFVGEVDDLAAFYANVRVIVVPLRYGSGVKIKTIEALQYAVPSVATIVGAEGLPIDDPAVLPATDDPTEFAEWVALWLSDPTAWERQRRTILEQYRRWEDRERRSTWVELASRLAVPVRVMDPALT
ncbi:MAG: wbbL 4 [Acidimicrobiaceae bacterium]|nr:wbbL 4 [Acidimicrobiaceae bacterium]